MARKLTRSQLKQKRLREQDQVKEQMKYFFKNACTYMNILMDPNH
jgi:hypothetical protein